jgi:hypothetical protein
MKFMTLSNIQKSAFTRVHPRQHSLRAPTLANPAPPQLFAVPNHRGLIAHLRAKIASIFSAKQLMFTAQRSISRKSTTSMLPEGYV